jgi:hypothetical protein
LSLTARIKSESTRQYQASDGTTYLLQRVNDASSFLSEDMLPALLKHVDFEKDDVENMTNQDLLNRLRGDPETAGKALRLGMNERPRKLRQGLVGELLPDGKPLYYRWVDKPVHQLAEGELNVDFIPDELAAELVAQIERIGAPVVEARAVSTFPGEQHVPAGSQARERNGEAA